MNHSISTIFLKFNHYIQNFGVEIVVGKLKELDETEPTGRNKQLELFIISECCSQYNIDKKEIKKNTRISAEALVARNMCFILLKKHFADYPDRKIAKMLDKDTDYPVRTAMKEFQLMAPKIKHEKVFLDTYHALNDKINTFKVQVKLINN